MSWYISSSCSISYIVSNNVSILPIKISEGLSIDADICKPDMFDEDIL